MEVDLPDMEGGPFINTPETGQELQAQTFKQDLEALPSDAADHEIFPALGSFDTSPAGTGSEPKQAEEAPQDAALQLENAPLTPVLVEEENPPAAAQVRPSPSRQGNLCTTVCPTMAMTDIASLLMLIQTFRQACSQCSVPSASL